MQRNMANTVIVSPMNELAEGGLVGAIDLRNHRSISQNHQMGDEILFCDRDHPGPRSVTTSETGASGDDSSRNETESLGSGESAITKPQNTLEVNNVVDYDLPSHPPADISSPANQNHARPAQTQSPPTPPQINSQRSRKLGLGLRLVCPDCREPHPNIVEDFSAGDLLCGDCGRESALALLF